MKVQRSDLVDSEGENDGIGSDEDFYETESDVSVETQNHSFTDSNFNYISDVDDLL